jgi:hypothetical protein
METIIYDGIELNHKYDTNLKVKDMQQKEFELIQSESDIAQFNEKYQENYSYYFIKWCDDVATKLYGSDRIFMNSNVYFVADI